MTYPAQLLTGQAATVNLQATAKSSLGSATVTAQIFYANGNNVTQLTTASISSSGNVNSGTVLSKQIQFTVPSDAPRTSIVALVSENVQMVNSYYYGNSGYYYSPFNDYSDCYYAYSYYYGSCGYYGNYFSYPYPSPYSTTSTDSAIAPLSYIMAQTPEYVSLQSQYQEVQQQLNQSQAQNQQLQQQVSQQSVTISSLNQQVNANQGTNTTLEAVAAGLAVLALVFGALAVHGRSKNKSAPIASPSHDPQ
jgi:hypothetical protein